MKIKFLNLQVVEMNLRTDTYDQFSTDEIESGPFKINCHVGKPEEMAFGISFEIALKNEEDSFNLFIRAIAHFDTDAVISNDFMQSDFVFINAPAIAFPFLRTFISNVTLNSGYNPIVLPAFNFVAMAKQMRERGDSLNNSKSIKQKKTAKKLHR